MDESATTEATTESTIEATTEATTEAYTPTTGEENALNKAYNYLDSMAFSKSGLIEQLEYEGFTKSEAKYAVNNCGANWKEQAAKKAEQYLTSQSFSRSGLIEQLEYEGFTNKQARYGVNNHEEEFHEEKDILVNNNFNFNNFNDRMRTKT